LTRVDPRFARKLTHLLSLVLLAGCVFVPRVMWRRAEENERHINQIRVGQTVEEVRAIMGKDPERREARARFDGKTVEMWSYVTDYARKLDTTIIFVDGRVQELRATPWEDKD
jgi:hypothetical protein